MAHEQLRLSTIVRSLADVVEDLSALLQKEAQLARAELSANISAKLHGGLWLCLSAGLTGVALLLCFQAVVFGLASYGVALHWYFFIVACGIAFIAALAFLIGRADADRSVLPKRTIHQIQQDVVLSKEQLR